MTEKFTIKKAKPIDEYLRIGLAGPSTSGKTVSGIRLALGLVEGTGKRVCIIDTENNRSLKYAKQFDFDHIDLQPPFTSQRYLEAIQAATAAGYGAIVVDSMSHEHEGVGGMLERHESEVEAMVKRNSSSMPEWKKREAVKFTAWIQPKADRNKLIQHGIQRPNAHLILCFRAKEKLEMKQVVTENNTKKTEINPLGWAPIGGEEFPYEMLSVMIMPPRSNGKPDWSQSQATMNTLDPDLKRLLTSIEQISEQTGKELLRLTRASDVAAPPATVAVNKEQLLSLATTAASDGTASYREFFTNLSKPEQQAIKEDHEGFKEQASQVDRQRLDGSDFPGDR